MSIAEVLAGTRSWHIEQGDCLSVLSTLPDASVHACVTDPPYGLEFMGKSWDAPWKKGSGTGEHNAGFSAGAPARGTGGNQGSTQLSRIYESDMP